jgi:hypothetical protein
LNRYELLTLLQTGYSRPIARFLVTWIAGPVVFFYVYQTLVALFWSAAMSGRTIWSALPRLPPILVILLVALWVLVFIHLRPRDEHPDTLVALVRFWRDYLRFQETVSDVDHDGFRWTVSTRPTSELPADWPEKSCPGLKVKLPPRCRKCNLEIADSQFKGGYYWICPTCNVRCIRRYSLPDAAVEVQRLSEQAWQLVRPVQTGVA